MWTLFKLVNFAWLMCSTYVWFTTMLPLMPILFVVNVLMITCLSFLPLKIEFTKSIGLIAASILLLVLWEIRCSGYVMGIYTMMCYMPAIYLVMLSTTYLQDLLQSITKWYAVLLAPALLLYWLTMFTSVPSFGEFVHPTYKPYVNYLFYIKTTFDHGMFDRFNAFFLEPGHQALLSSFLLMANRFSFRKMPWLWILAISVVFSFSLAGYLLLATGFALLYINSLTRAFVALAALAAIVFAAINIAGEGSALNDLIISRLEYDDDKGIKGNNRFTTDTDFVYQQALKKGNAWTGVKEKTNMDLIAGAGFKIYVINYGFVGVFLVLLFYICLIPPDPDYRFTIAFLIMLALCFLSRAYPGWYSWIFTYVSGIYIAKADKAENKIFQFRRTT